MHRRILLALPLAAALACGGEKKAGGADSSAANTTATSGADLTGAGATFPYPIYSKWFGDYATSTGVKINYQSIGSGGGIRQLTEGTVDFGASDAPMTDAELAKAKGPILHFPTVLGAVVITYNLPGVTQPLKLSGDVVAQIFLGKITKWNDSRIAALNSGVKLPAKDILVVHRSDGSGTTYIFSDYLSAVSPAWAAAPGKGKELPWPVGIGAKGNEGVAGQVKQTRGRDRLRRARVRQAEPPRDGRDRESGGRVRRAVDRVGDRRRRGDQREASAEHRLPHLDRERARRGCLSDLVVHLAA